MSETEHLRELLRITEDERDHVRSLLAAMLSMPSMDRTVAEYQRVALGWVSEVKEARAANVTRRAQEAMAKTATTDHRITELENQLSQARIKISEYELAR